MYLLGLGYIRAVASRVAGERIQENIVPIAANAEAADADILLAGFFRKFQAGLFISIGMAVRKKDDVIDALLVEAAADFCHAGLQSLIDLRRAAGLYALYAALQSCPVALVGRRNEHFGAVAETSQG